MLAENNINIASFHLGRSEKSGEAIALIAVDQEVNKRIIKSINELEHVVRVDSMIF